MSFSEYFYIFNSLAGTGGWGLRERGGGDEKWEEGDALSAPPPGGENLNLFEKEIEQTPPPPLGGVFSPPAGELKKYFF